MAGYLLMVLVATGFSHEAMPQSGPDKSDNRAEPAMMSREPGSRSGSQIALVDESRGNRAAVVTPNRGNGGRWQTDERPPIQTPNRGNAANFHAWGRGRVPVTPNQ